MTVQRLIIRLCRMVLGWLLALTRNGVIEIHDAVGMRRYGAAKTSDLHAVVNVHDERSYVDVLTRGSVGLGQSYAKGWWDPHDLTTFLRILSRTSKPIRLSLNRPMQRIAPLIDRLVLHRAPKKHVDAENISAHYDMGNEMFATFLDESMTYSSGLFRSPSDTLHDASMHKLDRIAQQIGAQEHMHVLEIGTGWGSCALHLAQRYGCTVTTVTLSREQSNHARTRVAEANLAHRVDVQWTDYRDVRGTFDAIVAIEMIEAVDWRRYGEFFDTLNRLAKPDATVAMQAIVVPDANFDRSKHHTDFIKAQIFPGGCLPSVAALRDAARHNGQWELTDRFDFGHDYARTLRDWQRNASEHRERLRALGVDDKQYRRMMFYFAYCEAGFDEEEISVTQLTFRR